MRNKVTYEIDYIPEGHLHLEEGWHVIRREVIFASPNGSRQTISTRSLGGPYSCYTEAEFAKLGILERLRRKPPTFKNDARVLSVPQRFLLRSHIQKLRKKSQTLNETADAIEALLKAV